MVRGAGGQWKEGVVGCAWSAVTPPHGPGGAGFSGPCGQPGVRLAARTGSVAATRRVGLSPAQALIEDGGWASTPWAPRGRGAEAPTKGVAQRRAGSAQAVRRIGLPWGHGLRADSEASPRPCASRRVDSPSSAQGPSSLCRRAPSGQAVEKGERDGPFRPEASPSTSVGSGGLSPPRSIEANLPPISGPSAGGLRRHGEGVGCSGTEKASGADDSTFQIPPDGMAMT